MRRNRLGFSIKWLALGSWIPFPNDRDSRWLVQWRPGTGKILVVNIDERIIALQSSIAELHATALMHGVNIESLHSSATELHASTADLRAAAVQDGINIRALADSIAALARIAEAHGTRLSNLEGGSHVQ